VATLLDHQIGIKEESVYGAPVVVDRFYGAESVTSEWDPKILTGTGIRGGQGRRSVYSDRVVVPAQGVGTISIKVQPESKGFGILLKAAFGTGTAATVTGGSVQTFHPRIAGVLLPSYTIQHVKIDATGTARAETYAGCTPTKATLEQAQGEVPTLTVEFDALTLSTATGAATATYPTSPNLPDYSRCAVACGGTLTLPTSTALATGLTTDTAWREFTLEIDHQIIADDRINLPGRLQPLAGQPAITLKGTVDYASVTLRDAVIAGTRMPWYATWTMPGSVGAASEALQLVVPAVGFGGAMPIAEIDSVPSLSLDGTVYSVGTTAEDVYLLYRTTDVAL